MKDLTIDAHSPRRYAIVPTVGLQYYNIKCQKRMPRKCIQRSYQPNRIIFADSVKLVGGRGGDGEYRVTVMDLQMH